MKYFLTFLFLGLAAPWLTTGEESPARTPPLASDIVLEVISATPAAPASLQPGDKITVSIRYAHPEAENVRVWAQPSWQGQILNASTYSPSPELPGDQGEITRSFSTQHGGTMDAIRLHMIDASTRTLLAKVFHPYEATWEASSERSPAESLLGKPFPGMTFTALDGQFVDVAAMKGKVVWIDFWATWCGPCRRKIPDLIAAYEQYRGAGFEIVAISLDKDEQALRRYIEEHNLTWPQHFDGKGWENVFARQFDIHGIPDSFLLDRQGVVRYRGLRGDAIERAVAELLK
ncbi:MAG TPA: TlpA disulfide reductase family protein [Kiritimatiellia bacterium]|nr:TlpA disulfide reductase family protein [Kiritimatiellia bacterium]HMP00776.1 TlpA disulfide reductase family protein [Kiritimatiellia bacterium]HMP96738.1 TlpA disulfide reductase family protein [Kiritimatiellia bacterium]